MGRCKVCGKIYCNCPGDGICASCASKSIQKLNVNGTTVYHGECGFDSKKITELRDFTISLRSNGGANKLGLTEVTVNMYISYAVSAWNYRHEPCKFENELRKIEVLRKIYALSDNAIAV